MILLIHSLHLLRVYFTAIYIFTNRVGGGLSRGPLKETDLWSNRALTKSGISVKTALLSCAERSETRVKEEKSEREDERSEEGRRDPEIYSSTCLSLFHP